MKTLTLLRHAKSGWDDTVARDFDRPLNDKGRRAARTMGRHLAREGLRFDRVIASPAVRVVETLAEVGATCGQSLDPIWDKRLYLAPAEQIMEVVAALAGDAATLLVVGHNPGLEELVLDLADAGAARAAVEMKFPTAALAELTWEGEWTSPGSGGATLARFTRPRDLDPRLGPDD
ncbi:SixA phosphatase family protein [Sphingomonas rubra]|uniref:Phosphohistidine phosphatase n=1 Tax=Sphingomonas rubra TaxID=634430 RepID=A0A1I5TMI9_9SPHN|nr:histidine phosphatase family protein [Sphingomonas rubra]SFP84091.1 phosphohistidine phosphatase [Sphingomonas rubra]